MNGQQVEFILKQSRTPARQPVLELLERLEKWGAYIYHVANTGSTYIKFPHWGLGSIRLADHKGKEKYRYRWNVDLRRSKADTFELRNDKGTSRVICGVNRLHDLQIAFEESAARRGISPGDCASWKGSLNGIDRTKR